MDVARRGEDTGYGVPCLFVAAKDDLDSYPMATRDSEAVINLFKYFFWEFFTTSFTLTSSHNFALQICQELKIDAPIRISVKKREMNNIFWRIVNAAERCHLSVPETEYGRNMKQYRRIVNRSLMLASGKNLKYTST